MAKLNGTNSRVIVKELNGPFQKLNTFPILDWCSGGVGLEVDSSWFAAMGGEWSSLMSV
jgi:hypothetical protein